MRRGLCFGKNPRTVQIFSSSKVITATRSSTVQELIQTIILSLAVLACMAARSGMACDAKANPPLDDLSKASLQAPASAVTSPAAASTDAARPNASANVLMVWRVPGTGKMSYRSLSLTPEEFEVFKKATASMPKDKISALMEQGKGMTIPELIALIREKDIAAAGLAAAR